MRIYIYEIKKLDDLMVFFESVPPEMDLYDVFLKKLKSKYEIVDDVNDADIAFIPVDFIKLIYGKVKDNEWHLLYKQLKTCDKYSDLTPVQQPPTFGVGYKESYIRFFWSNFIKDNISHNLKTPHFILYNYVLFETSFESVDKDVFILSYEDEVTFFNTEKTFKIGTYDRVIPIPYILNENSTYSLPLIEKMVPTEKVYDLTFIGSLNSENRPLINRFRNFITTLNSNVHIGDMSNIEDELINTKYLFVLRGDTPTRSAFYQCFAYNIVPIIFKEELDLYQKIFTEDIDLRKSCLILPNKDEMSDIEYSIIVDKILNEELSDLNNYLNKIESHKLLFDQINYFNDESLPIEISMGKILKKSNQTIG